MNPDKAALLGLATVLLAVLPSLSLLVLPRRDKTTTRLRIAVVFAMTVLVMRVGFWSFASVQARVLGFVGLLVGTLGAGIRGRLVADPARGRVVVHAAMAAALLALDVWAFSASSFAAQPVRLHLPLGRGSYCVLAGGSSAIANVFVAPGKTGERAGLALVKLGSFGNRAQKLQPRALEDFASYGALVVAPCDGDVLAVEGGLPDASPGQPDAAHPSGNYVVLQCETGLVRLGYLQHASIRVAVGGHVRAGKDLAKMGSSGAAFEPMLSLAGFPLGTPLPAVLSGPGDAPLEFEGHVLVSNTDFTVE